jgi:hypothetical protein
MKAWVSKRAAVPWHTYGSIRRIAFAGDKNAGSAFFDGTVVIHHLLRLFVPPAQCRERCFRCDIERQNGGIDALVQIRLEVGAIRHIARINHLQRNKQTTIRYWTAGKSKGADFQRAADT